MEAANMSANVEAPEGLSDNGKAAHNAIMKMANKHGIDYFGSQQTFYSPEEWSDRGEDYGCTSELVVMYEDNGLKVLFDYDAAYPGYELLEEMNEALAEIGLFFECATCWYGSIHRV